MTRLAPPPGIPPQTITDLAAAEANGNMATLAAGPLTSGGLTVLSNTFSTPNVSYAFPKKNMAIAVSWQWTVAPTGADQLASYVIPAGINTANVSVAHTAIDTLSAALALNATYNNGAAGVGATLTNAGANAQLTINGAAQVNGNYVLVNNQADPKQNGLYTVTTQGTGATPWVITRAAEFNGSSAVLNGLICPAISTANTQMYTGGDNPVFGTTPITFTSINPVRVSITNARAWSALQAPSGTLFIGNVSSGGAYSLTSTVNVGIFPYNTAQNSLSTMGGGTIQLSAVLLPAFP